MMLVPVVAGIALVAWAVAVVAGLMLIRHRRADISLLRLFFSGLVWFDRSTFRPEAAGIWRVFATAAAVFAGAIAAAVAISFAAMALR